MLGFFFRHFDPWVDRYVVYDDGSTDGSRDILAAHPKVELRTFQRSNEGSFCLSQQALQDEFWKESRAKADWVVVTAIDEHLHVPGRAMADYLAEQTKRGATVLPALGFDMNHPTMPDDSGVLVQKVTRGRPRTAFNKLSIFNPDAVRETGFGAGRHRAVPVGDFKLPARNEIVLWHYKHLGFERCAEREATQAARLGPTDVAQDLAQHYLWSKAELRAFWDQMERESIDLSGRVADRVCVGPLWWSERTDMVRVGTKVEPLPRGVPTVSVLVKSYNHASYIGQTIESVLAQSFQDFEIVVTDDASTDGTADVVRGFDDPRIRLEVLPRNLGISGAMNATIDRARGRYLAILNSDDWALPGRLKRQVEFLDANPHVDLVFGLPRPVDEHGMPAEASDDFRAPLGFPDFSRKTWVGGFLNGVNCLCAPTAMIRREAYEVGPYDRRLTNLQDFDMWVRMVLAGHTIHLLDEELTAFRIRDKRANMSASRPDSRMRTAFEMSRVLRRFLDLDDVYFECLFGDMARESAGRPVAERIAILALRDPAPFRQLFALEAFYESAIDDDAFDKLRELAGSMDLFGDEAWLEAESRSAELTAAATATRTAERRVLPRWLPFRASRR